MHWPIIEVFKNRVRGIIADEPKFWLIKTLLKEFGNSGTPSVPK